MTQINATTFIERPFHASQRCLPQADGQLHGPPERKKPEGNSVMLQILLVIVLVFVALSLFGGYSGYVPSHFGYGGGGLGLVLLIVLIVLLLR